MSTPVNLFGEDIATNPKFQSLFDQINSHSAEADYQTLIEGIPELDAPAFLYLGRAPKGALETSPTWNIRFIQITATDVIVRSAKSVAWSNRVNEVYT